MIKVFLLACFVAFVFAQAEVAAEVEAGVEGFDLSVHQGNVSQESYNCLARTYKFAVLHGYRSNGQVNIYVIDGIKRARKAGIQDIDIYVFLHFKKDPRLQIRETIDFIVKRGGQTFNRIWLDIEGANYWGTCPQNQVFFEAAGQEVIKQGYKLGIYSGASQWAPIMCGYQGFKQYPMWYAHYDGKKDFSTFRPYGGWVIPGNPPVAKQYAGTTSACGTSIDKNWAPKIPK
jgi:GH25 family lysozyme M1 (1,4-beta-N-acetylmuramidase)